MTQPEALRLADELDQYLYSVPAHPLCTDAAAELRRLHEGNKLLRQRHYDDNVEYTRVLAQRDALMEALQDLCDTLGECGMTEKARAVIKKVQEGD